MANTTEVPMSGKPAATNKLSLGKRLLIAIPMAVVFIGVGAVVYYPAFALGGFATDSCSNGNIETLWMVWLQYLWPLVMLVGAALPPLLVALGRRWRWVIISAIAGLAVSIVWYVLWFVIASFAC